MKTAYDNRSDNPYRVCYTCFKRYVSYAPKHILLCPVCCEKPKAQAMVVGVQTWEQRK